MLATLWSWLNNERGFFGGGGESKRAPVTPVPPQESDPQVQNKRAARRYKAGLEGGYQSTIATSALGSSQQAQGAPGSVQKLGG
jgi:hypothetical protein